MAELEGRGCESFFFLFLCVFDIQESFPVLYFFYESSSSSTGLSCVFLCYRELKEQSSRLDVTSAASLTVCEPQRSVTPRLLKVGI